MLAASYEAKRRGVRTAMGGRQARALCPNLIIVRPRFDAYVEASKAVFELFRRTTPQVQGVSIDEAFLDVSGLHRIDVPPLQIGARLREWVRDEVGLPITVGVARTPFLAKVASRVAKPDGLLLVPPDGEDAFLYPLPLEQLWGVGEITAAKLHTYGLRTAGDVAALPQSVLTGTLGPAAGRHLYAVVHGQTPATVITGRPRGSIGAQRAIGHGPHQDAFVRAALLGLVDRVCRRMRTGHRTARTVVLRLRFEDYTKATRSRSMPQATSSGADIATTALLLLDAAGPLIRSRGITLVGHRAHRPRVRRVLPDGAPPGRPGPQRPRRRAGRGLGALRHVRGAAGQPAAHGRGLRRAAAPPTDCPKESTRPCGCYDITRTIPKKRWQCRRGRAESSSRTTTAGRCATTGTRTAAGWSRRTRA